MSIYILRLVMFSLFTWLAWQNAKLELKLSKYQLDGQDILKLNTSVSAILAIVSLTLYFI